MVFGREISPSSPKPGGGFENPRGQHAVPEGRSGGQSGGPRARRAARGGFQNPRTGEGDLDENPGPKTRILKKTKLSLLSDIQVRRPLPVTQVLSDAICVYLFLSVGTKSM